MMRLPFLLRKACWVCCVMAICLPSVVLCHNIEFVMSISQFYDTCNNNETYTFVKYSTTWCRHCVRLKPIFEELSDLYTPENDNSSYPSVRFLEVDCEVFGSTVCSGIPGYPTLQLVKPRKVPLEIPETNWDAMPIWQKMWTKLQYKFRNPSWHLGSEYVVEYTGSRDLESMQNFIEAVREKESRESVIDIVLDQNKKCKEDHYHCQEGKIYYSNVLKPMLREGKLLATERTRLENILRNNQAVEGTDALDMIRFQLDILNHVEDQSGVMAHDEL